MIAHWLIFFKIYLKNETPIASHFGQSFKSRGFLILVEAWIEGDGTTGARRICFYQ